MKSIGPGGAILLGATGLIAFFDGGLSACLVGAAIGGGTYAAALRALNQAPNKIKAMQEVLLAEEAKKADEQGRSEQDVNGIKREASKQFDSIRNTHVHQLWGNKELAMMAGVAGFACPVLGAAVITGLTADLWVKPVEAFGRSIVVNQSIDREDVSKLLV